MSEMELFISMLDRAGFKPDNGYVVRAWESDPEFGLQPGLNPAWSVLVYNGEYGYIGFMSEWLFDTDGKLVTTGAWE